MNNPVPYETKIFTAMNEKKKRTLS